MSDVEQNGAALPQPDPSLFAAGNEVKAAFIKWGKVGDWFEGTLHEVREVESRLPGQEGEKQKIYDFIARSGAFNDKIVVKNPDGTEAITYKQTVLKKGELWSLGGSKAVDDAMRRIKYGQIFGVRFTELKPSKTKGFADTKVRKVYPGAMDKEYTGAVTGADQPIPVEDIPM